MKNFLVATLVIICGVAQGAKTLEELKLELGKASTVKQSVHTKTNISYLYSRTSPDSGLVYGQEALKEAIRHNLKYEEARANSALGINYLVRGEYRTALELQFRARKLYEELDSLKDVAGVHSNISLIFMNQSDYLQAMEYALKALSMYEEIEDRHNKGIVLGNIGTLLFRQQDYVKAKNYYQEAAKIHLYEGDSLSLARNKGNIGMVYSAIGEYDKAKTAFTQALAFNRKNNNQRSVQINFTNLGLLEVRRENYSRAIAYYDSARTIAERMGLKLDYANILGNMGEAYVKMASSNKDRLDDEMLAMGVSYLNDGISQGLALSSPDPTIGFYQALSEAYALSGNFKEALEVYKKGEKLKDSIHSFGNRISLENMEILQKLAAVDQDLEEKSQELKIKSLELNKTRQTIALYIMGLVILILAGIVVIIQLRKTKLRNKKLIESNALYASKIEEQLDSLKKHSTVLDEITYMQAHHVREPVATILGLVEHFNIKDPNDPMNVFVLENLTKVTEKLDVAVREVINKKEEV